MVILLGIDLGAQLLSPSGNAFGFESSLDGAAGRARASSPFSSLKRAANKVAEALLSDLSISVLGTMVRCVDVEHAVSVDAVAKPSNDLILLVFVEHSGVARRPMQRDL